MNAPNCSQRRATSHKYPQILHPASPASHNKVDIYEQLVSNNVNPSLNYTNQTHMQFWILPLACLGLSGIETDGPRGGGRRDFHAINRNQTNHRNQYNSWELGQKQANADTITTKHEKTEKTQTKRRKRRKHKEHKENTEN